MAASSILARGCERVAIGFSARRGLAALLGEAAVLRGLGVLRIGAQRRVELLDGAGTVAGAQVEQAAGIAGVGVAGLAPDRLVEVEDGTIVLAHQAPGVAAVGE